MFETLKALKLKEIIGYAVMSEEAAAKFYRGLAEDTNVNELVAHRFEHIAMEEDIHRKVLAELHTRLFGNEKIVAPMGLPPFESPMEVTTVYNMIEALQIAMVNEDNAVRVYKFLASHHREYRRLFKHLAAKEHAHYHTLKIEKDLYEEEMIEEGHQKSAPVANLTAMYWSGAHP